MAGFVAPHRQQFSPQTIVPVGGLSPSGAGLVRDRFFLAGAMAKFVRPVPA